jgi:hypothetical protein
LITLMDFRPSLQAKRSNPDFLRGPGLLRLRSQ